MTYRVLDLFSGIGGFSLGLERTGGFKTVAFCEIEPFCQRVLAKHWPGVPLHNDVTTREFRRGEADVVTGGFPCQDVSLAGKRAGLAGANSGLYRELVRALRVVRPRYGIVENVAALLSDGMGTVLGDLAESGVDAEWDCVPARAIGAPHERDRVWIVAHASGDGRCAGAARDQQHREPIHHGNRVSQGAPGGRQDIKPRVAGSVDPVADIADAGSMPRRQRLEPASVRRRAIEAEQTRLGACGNDDADPARIGCGQGRARRPSDSFAWVRDEARRNAADPYGARLAFREGFTRDAREELAPAQRDGLGAGGQPIWPDEPALSRVDDGIPNWLDRVRATGNAVVPQIPELIGRAILAAERCA